jgi:hypothetical protein
LLTIYKVKLLKSGVIVIGDTLTLIIEMPVSDT